ncbi:MAG: DUF4382 domain-containing protein [Halobacteriales archaeon]
MVAKILSTLAVATLVVLAGCTGFAPGQGNSPTADNTLADGGTEATADGGTEAMSEGGGAATTGVVQFYLSDERNAIGDFEHLNVTITKVGFQRADAEGDSEDNETETDEETPDRSTVTTTENATATTDSTTTTVDSTATSENATPTGSPTVTDESEDGEDESDDEEMEREDGEAGGWTEYDVESRTVDLTRLQGDNATLLSEFDVPEGSYSKVFVHVSEVEGTLENGESVNVKLPSEKLQLTKGFTVEANESVDFVFDITVFKAGNSGKYILKPVISESGTDVPIEDVDEERDDAERDDQQRDEEDRGNDEREDQGDEEREDRNRDARSSLNASFVGAVEPGSNATVRVTSNGSAVANATVYMDGEAVGVTGDGGELTFLVPADAEAVEVTVESGDAEAELEAEFEGREETEKTETDDTEDDENSGNGTDDGSTGQDQ